MKTRIYFNDLLVMTFNEDKNFKLYDKANILTTDCFVVEVDIFPSGYDMIKSIYFKDEKYMQDYKIKDLTDIKSSSTDLENNIN